MTHKPTLPRRLLALALLAVLCVTMAFAQLDPGYYNLYQNDRLVGVIYVPARTAGQNIYSEHWILFAGYQYPSAANQAKLKIAANPDARIASEADFFKTAPWGPGYRYVHTSSYDTTTLPGR